MSQVFLRQMVQVEGIVILSEWEGGRWGFEKKEHPAISALLPSDQIQSNFTMRLIMFATVHGFGSSPLSYKVFIKKSPNDWTQSSEWSRNA